MPPVEIQFVAISQKKAVMITHLEMNILRPDYVKFISSNALSCKCERRCIQMQIIAIFDTAQRQFLDDFSVSLIAVKSNYLNNTIYEIYIEYKDAAIIIDRFGGINAQLLWHGSEHLPIRIVYKA